MQESFPQNISIPEGEIDVEPIRPFQCEPVINRIWNLSLVSHSP